MEKYFAAVGNPLSENQLEKATYTSAYDAYYTQKNCDLAMPKWESYIAKFPNGKYISEAQFNFAECAYSKGMFDKAIVAYQFIIEKPRGIYSEASIAKTSYLFFKDKKYEQALPLFIRLQDVAETPSNKSAGKFGAMRCAFNLNQFETALTECNKVLSTEKLTPQQTSEAKYIKAKSLYETNRLDDALIEFKAMTKTSKNLTGAEAYYHIAKIYFAKQDYKEVEKTINKLISYEYSNDDWNNKGMLLYADMYLAREDEADAEVILQTIIDGKPKQEYLDEAKKRLDALKAKQQSRAANLMVAPPTEMKLEFNQSKKDSALFNNLNQETENQATPTQTLIEQPK